MAKQHTEVTNTLLAGRYRLGRVIGRGGMADVRSAYDELAGRTVAVKLFRTDLDEPESAARRQAEGRIARELVHPGLVRVYDTSFEGERAFLVMELVLGSTLEELAADGPLPLSQVADLGSQLADTLASVHAAEIVHRDVKPSNVLLASAGRGRWRTKLTDFGISRKIDATRLTSTGLLVGTARYLSPEQAAGEDVGVASDVYSLGLVLLECLTGEKPYPGNIIETTVARLTRPPEIPASLGPVAELLCRMTAREPTARPAMVEVASRLRSLAELDETAVGGLPVEAMRAAEEPPLASATGRAARTRHTLVGAAAALALVGSLIGVLGNDPPSNATASSQPSPQATAADGDEPAGEPGPTALPDVTAYDQRPRPVTNRLTQRGEHAAGRQRHEPPRPKAPKTKAERDRLDRQRHDRPHRGKKAGKDRRETKRPDKGSGKRPGRKPGRGKRKGKG